MTPKKKATKSWFDVLEGQGLAIRSIRNAASVAGWLDTGNYALNWAISGRFLRGYPLGHSLEMFGDPSTGKSYLVARALAMLQEAGGVALLDDTEGGYSAEWTETLGVDIDTIPVQRSRTFADHLKATQAFITAYEEYQKAGGRGPGLVVCDSLAQLTTAHELEVELEKRDLSKSKELKTFFRIVGGRLIELPVIYICTNHVYDNIGDRFQRRTTPGGRGPKYQSSVRLDLRTPSKILNPDKEKVGVMVRIVVEKNRFTAPWKEVRLAIPFNQPISRASGLIPILLDLGILEESGNFVRYKGEATRIRMFKTKDKMLRQDEEGERLLDLIPEILEEADVLLAERNPGVAGAILEEAEEEA